MPHTQKIVQEDPIAYSVRVQSGASSEGFDWDHVSGVLSKVEEELEEIRSALDEGDVRHARRELGDLLLVAVNLGRFLGADPGEELSRATERFECRYEQLKKALAEDGKTPETCTADELETVWQRIKPLADKLLNKRLDMRPEDGANSSSVL